MTVVCISRDTGGTRGLLRVAEELRRLRTKVFFFAQAGGLASKTLTGAGKEFVSVSSFQEVLDLIEDVHPRVFLTSWCSNLGRDVLPFLNEHGILTALVEDSWWHGGALDPLPPDRRPTLVCVGTEHDRQRVLAAWSGYPAEQVQVTGWPDFDLYAEYDVTSVTDRVRASLGFNENWPLTLLSIDNNLGIGELCRDFVDALNGVARPSYLIPAWHPGFDHSVPEERPEVEAALAGFEAGTLVDRGKIETAELVVAADVMVSTFSSLLTVGAALRKQVIAVLYTETGLKQMWTEMGVPELPLVELGCAAKAMSRGELAILLRRALLKGGFRLEEAQRRNFRLDGQNARRVAELIIK